MTEMSRRRIEVMTTEQSETEPEARSRTAASGVYGRVGGSGVRVPATGGVR